MRTHSSFAAAAAAVAVVVAAERTFELSMRDALELMRWFYVLTSMRSTS